MKLMLIALLALLVVLFPAGALAETAADWAYAAMPLNNEAYRVGTIYYVSSHFTTNSVNPLTGAKYTEAEVAAILRGADEGAEGYVKDVPLGAVIGMNVYGTDDVLWFDADNAAAILSHADPLSLNPETGAMSTADGTIVAIAMNQ